MVRYEIQTRRTCFAVIRYGPKGGSKFITAYKMEHQAQEICDALNRWASQEI